MIDTVLLNKVVEDSGVTKIWLANKIGCSRPRLYRILEGGNVTLAEVESLCEALGISASTRNKIFFAQRVE